MSEDIAPYIVGFTRVTLGDTEGFICDESDEEPLFSWVEDGRISSLPWAEAVQRFGAPRSDQSAQVAREAKPALLLRRESGRFSGLSASAFFHHRLFCCRKHSTDTSVSVTINDAAFPTLVSSF